MPGGDTNALWAERQRGRERPGRRRQRPPVVGGQPLDETGMIDLTAVIRMSAVQARAARVGRVGIREPQRPVISGGLSPADSPREPLPGLAAAHRTAHSIAAAPARDRFSHQAHSRRDSPGRDASRLARAERGASSASFTAQLSPDAGAAFRRPRRGASLAIWPAGAAGSWAVRRARSVRAWSRSRSARARRSSRVSVSVLARASSAARSSSRSASARTWLSSRAASSRAWLASVRAWSARASAAAARWLAACAVACSLPACASRAASLWPMPGPSSPAAPFPPR